MNNLTGRFSASSVCICTIDRPTVGTVSTLLTGTKYRAGENYTVTVTEAVNSGRVPIAASL